MISPLGLPLDDAIETIAALVGVVLEDVHAVDAGHRHEDVAHVLGGALAVEVGDHGELAAQDLGQEVAVTARGLQEAALDALGLLLDHVQHGVHLALAGKHLSVLLHELL